MSTCDLFMAVSRQKQPARCYRQKVSDAAIRSCDVSLAMVALLLTFPLLVVVAVAVRLDSGRPVLFRQERIGRYFRPFQILKFRTMVSDVSQGGAPLTVGEDARVTRIGRILRRFKIDELPQLANVLKGEMSLVGPRPEVRQYVEMYRQDYERILSVRPGITDPASIKFRNESELLAQYDCPEQAYANTILPRKLQLARQYVDHRSLWLHVKLICRTFAAVFSPSVHAVKDSSDRSC